MNFKIIIALFLTIPLFNKSGRDCDVFKNGNYHITFDEFFKQYEDCKIVICNGKYTEYVTNNYPIKGSIESIYNCKLFKFKPNAKLTSDSAATELDKLIRKSFGEHCIEIKSINGDTISFRTTYEGNLHITINEGKIIRIH